MPAPYLRCAPNGTWYVHWTEHNVGRRVSTRTKDQGQATTFLAHWILAEDRRDANDGPTGGHLTLGEIWAAYFTHRVEARKTNVETSEYAWRVMEPFFGHVRLADLNQDLIDAYVAKRTSGKLTGRRVKPASVLRDLTLLMAAIRFCADARRKIIHPSLVPKFTLPEPALPRDRWLRTHEIQALLDAAQRLRRGDRLSRGERFLWLALETGARKQALLDLRWSQVDFETRVIHLNPEGRRQTQKKRPAVPISDALMPVLRRAWLERLTPSADGRVLDSPAAIWQTIQVIAVEAGLGEKAKRKDGRPGATTVSPHVLRHTAATHMARNGVSLFKIAKVLGNTLTMVEKVYAKHAPEDLRDAVNSISRGDLEAAE